MVLDTGQALCFGNNGNGKLGLDSAEVSRGTAPGDTASSIVQVPQGASVFSVSAGDYHTCMLLDDGRALCFGANSNGQLGLDSRDLWRGTATGDTASAIVQVPSGASVFSVSVGGVHTCVVLLDGRALCFGNNFDGQLGLDSTDSSRGTATGETAFSIVKVPHNASVISVSAGTYHTCAVLLDGRALCFGDNGSGRLGLDRTDGNRGTAPGETASSTVKVPQGTNVTSISAGFKHTCMVLNDGRALCFGNNFDGQLGLDSTDVSYGRAAGETASSIVQVPHGTSVVSVSAGSAHTCVVLDNGQALCFGLNDNGQLGLDSTEQTRGNVAGDTASSVVRVPLIPSPSSSPTGTPSPSPTSTPSWSPTGTPSWSPTGTPSWSPTGTPSSTGTPSWSPTGTPSWSPTSTPSPSPTSTPSPSPTSTLSSSPTGTPSSSASPSRDPPPVAGPLGASPASDDDASLSPGPIAAATLVGVAAVGAGAVQYTRRRTGARRSARAVPPPLSTDAAPTAV